MTNSVIAPPRSSPDLSEAFRSSIARPPTRLQRASDRVVQLVAQAFGTGVLILMVAILPASLVLTIMILPTVTAISRDAIAAVPKRLPAAAYGLGATHWEVICRVVLPTASGGLFGSLVLGFGRALGETMALAMLIGNANVFGWSLFSPGTTLAALLANHFPEASAVESRALMYAALVLLLLTLLVNALGSLIMTRAASRLRGLS